MAPVQLNQIADHLTLMAQSHPGQLAVVCPEGRDRVGRVSYTHLTYRQLESEVQQASLRLLGFGVGKAERVALMTAPSLDFFVLTFALFRLGAVPVFIDPGIGVEFLKSCLKTAAPSVFIGSPKAQLARTLFGFGDFKKIVTVGSRFGLGGVSYDLLRQQPIPPSLADHTASLDAVVAKDQAAILFTSGSTGEPKGAIYTHEHFIAQVELLRSLYHIVPGEIDLCTFPLFALFAPALGMTAVIPDMDFTRPSAANPQRLIEPLKNFAVTNMFGSPALLKVLLRAVAKEPDLLQGLRRLISAGAPVPYQTLEALLPCLNQDADIFTPYGATESLPVASIGAREVMSDTSERTKRGEGICVGRVVPDTDVRIIRICDGPIERLEDHMVLAPGEMGEIIVRGRQVTRGYIHREDADRLMKIPSDEPGRPWHRMGDVGTFDERGRLWYGGRKSQRVRALGGDLFTIPLEQMIATHPEVHRAALVGVGLEGRERPVMMLEVGKVSRSDQKRIGREVLKAAGSDPKTRMIEQVLFRSSFPVDIRHNAKIRREVLKSAATKELAR